MPGYADSQCAASGAASVEAFTFPNVNRRGDKRSATSKFRSKYIAEANVKDSSNLLPRDISSRFGVRLRELRRARNMTQSKMAVDFGIDRSFISDVERGRKSISLHMLEVIALGLNVTLSDLLDGI